VNDPVRDEAEEAEVLVVGGGMVGLAAAIELGLRGVRTLVVEQATAIADEGSRASLLSARSMEHFRRWGIAEREREAALLPDDWPTKVCFATSLTGHELASLPTYQVTGGAAGNIASEDGARVPQFQTLRVLEEAARAHPSVRVERGWRCVSLSQHSDCVEALLEPIAGGPARKVRASFLIGADGGRGMVREAVGISYEGRADIGRYTHVSFTAPALIGALEISQATTYILVSPGSPAIVRPLDLARWDIQLIGSDDGVDPTALELADGVRRAIGRDGIAFEITDAAPVRMHDLIAGRWRSGRVLLAGDCAHLIVHYGGHNFNVGLGDAVDLGWKLAAVLAGWGGPRLLDSYELERRPIALKVRDEALANMAQQAQAVKEAAANAAPETDEPAARETRAAIGRALLEHSQPTYEANGLVLDQRYTDSPIVSADDSAVPEWNPRVLSLTVAAGHRAPHVAENGGSIHDAFGTWFTLLRLDAPQSGHGLLEAAMAAGVPVKPLERSGDRYTQAYGAALTLIRPDGHIAWRGDADPADPASIIETARGAVREPSR